MGFFFSRKRENLTERSWAPRWWAVLLVGLLLWIATVATAFFTGNLILLPMIVLLGSFLVPVTGVTWYLDHDPSPVLSPRRIMAAFIIAGVIGALAASRHRPWSDSWVWLRRAREQRLRAGGAVRRPGRSSLSLVDVGRLDRARS